MLRYLGISAMAVLLAFSGSMATAQVRVDPAARALIEAYVAAWDRADSKAMAATFAPDGDFVTPDGLHAVGRRAIASFYRSAFERGYRGRKGGFELAAAREVARGVLILDGTWSIAGERPGQSSGRPESGLATAVLIRTGTEWQISALREQSSATALRAFPAGKR